MLTSGLGVLARIAAACALVFMTAACSFGPTHCGGIGEPCCSTGAHCGSGMSCDGFILPTCESCGGLHQACCSAGAPCSSGLSCLAESFGSRRCEVCGGVGEPCCGTTCSSGLACQSNGSTRSCVTCGGSGQPCCPGSRCASSLACNDTGLCGPCGIAGEVCCAGRACVSPARCEGYTGNGTCAVCGGAGEPCCEGTRCEAAATSCRSGTCQPCGAIRGACCAGDTCPLSGTCIAGVCTAVVAPDASTTDASTTDAMSGDMTFASAACAPGSCDFAGMVCVPFPVSICSHACTRDADCGGVGTCLDGTCAPNCHPGHSDCDLYGGICFTAPTPYPVIAGSASMQSACIPSCFGEDVTRPARYPSCASGSVCNAATGGCVAATAAITLGAPCTGSLDCAGTCIGPTSPTAAATGFIGGYCSAYARNPETAAFAPGVPLPRSNCPSGGIAIPTSTSGPGDAVYCYAECSDDCDCRVGYRCDHDPMRVGGDPAPNGACLPIDCSRPGATCPAGSICGAFASSTYLRYPVCTPAADAGAVSTAMNVGCTGRDVDASSDDAAFDGSLDATAGD